MFHSYLCPAQKHLEYLFSQEKPQSGTCKQHNNTHTYTCNIVVENSLVIRHTQIPGLNKTKSLKSRDKLS